MEIKCPKCGGAKGRITTETEWYPAVCDVCWGTGTVQTVDHDEPDTGEDE